MDRIGYSWTKEDVLNIYNRPLLELVYEAATIHRQHHKPEEIQLSTLVNIKSGGCSEDCAYCSQSSRHNTQLERSSLLSVEEVKMAAYKAQKEGSSRLCMGAAWRGVKDNNDFDQVLEMVRIVNGTGMDVCCSLGMLTENQAKRLSEAGLYAYNHNLDTSEEYYKEVISTRKYKDRLDTIKNARKAGLIICSGGIIGMGEKVEDRIGLLVQLSQLNPIPESIPINALVPIKGTPLQQQKKISSWEIIRMIATTRIVMPKTIIRLSAGRNKMSHETQALCFLAGTGSIFTGKKLLTTPNTKRHEDKELFKILGLHPKRVSKKKNEPTIKSLQT